MRLQEIKSLADLDMTEEEAEYIARGARTAFGPPEEELDDLDEQEPIKSSAGRLGRIDLGYQMPKPLYKPLSPR